MFFFLSKILDVLLTPLAWATLLIATGLFRQRAGRGVGFGRILVALGLLVLLGFSEEPVSNALVRSLESPPLRTFRPGVTYDAVVLLGGLSEDRIAGTWGQRAFNDNSERLLQTFDLLRTGAAKNVIVSSGPVQEAAPEMSEAHFLSTELTRWGIDAGRVVVEDKARNTHENAVYSAAIVRARGWHTVLIVTSAYHMPRAYGCFVAEELPVDTYPVDFRSYDTPFTGELVPRAEHLAASTMAIREWFGRKIYSVRGFAR